MSVVQSDFDFVTDKTERRTDGADARTSARNAKRRLCVSVVAVDRLPVIDAPSPFIISNTTTTSSSASPITHRISAARFMFVTVTLNARPIPSHAIRTPVICGHYNQSPDPP